MSDVASIMRDLENAAKALDEASTRLARATQDFEGTTDEAGQWTAGPQLRFEGAVAEESARIYNEADGKIPPEAVRQTMAIASVKARDPELWADYHRLRSEIQALKLWISAKKESISARQSVLGAEKALLPLSDGQQPSWSKSAS